MIHTPVLADEVLKMVAEIPKGPGLFMDGTFGRGGHAREVMKQRSDLKILAFDCDEEAISFGRNEFKEEVSNDKIEFIQSNFSDYASHIKDKKLHGILLDLGVSSPQLDEAQRGFSFYNEGPLDMRMDLSQEFSAKDIVNTWAESDLIELFKQYGEVRNPTRVVRCIVHDRKEKLFTTTTQLSGLIERVEGWRKKGHHPATNYFLALRLHVNQELTRIENIIPQMVLDLVDNGRILVITFHSLEDRIVKLAFKDLQKKNYGIPVNKKVIQASWEEKKKNPRARSAKLRVFQRQNVRLYDGQDLDRKDLDRQQEEPHE